MKKIEDVPSINPLTPGSKILPLGYLMPGNFTHQLGHHRVPDSLGPCSAVGVMEKKKNVAKNKLAVKAS